MPKRVLIVDDSPMMRELLKYATNLLADVEVEQADDGVAALRAVKAAEAPYDLVLVDLNMPVMDGMKLLQFFSQDPALAGTPVVVITTESSEETEAQARSLGARHFLRKPLGPNDLVRVVRDVLG